MKLERKLICHPAYLQEISEDDAIFQGGCISICDEHQVEQMIFIYKNESSAEFEVRIHKANPTDTYVPSKHDKFVKRYEANDKFARFFFKHFLFACLFVNNLEISHPEYRVRPLP